MYIYIYNIHLEIHLKKSPGKLTAHEMLDQVTEAVVENRPWLQKHLRIVAIGLARTAAIVVPHLQVAHLQRPGCTTGLSLQILFCSSTIPINNLSTFTFYQEDTGSGRQLLALACNQTLFKRRTWRSWSWSWTVSRHQHPTTRTQPRPWKRHNTSCFLARMQIS